MTIGAFSNDQLLRGTAHNNQLRWSFVEAAKLCENACKIHDTDPAGALFFSQALISSALTIPLMKGNQRTTFRWQYEGALDKIIVDCGEDGTIRALLSHGQLSNLADHVDALFGETGTISAVISNPKTGAILRQSTTEAMLMDVVDDLAMMYCTSDQVETEIICSIRFEADPIHPIHVARGIMLQVLPGFDLIEFEKIRSQLRTKEVKNILADDTLDEVVRLEKILLFCGCDKTLNIAENKSLEYRCSCEKTRMIQSVKTLARSDLDTLFQGEQTLDLTCQFCRKTYTLTKEDLA